MRKIVIVPSVFLLNVMPVPFSNAEQDYYQLSEKSKEELMMDLFFSLLSPSVQEAVSDYYSAYLTTSPLVYPYQIKILKMERTNGYRGFMFLVTIEVTPVVRPHNPVGRDQLTFSITPSEIKLKKFKHMETYELPPNWQDIKKKNS
ncbi:Protein of unknown function [Psychrobacillus sp. OK028]|uniref:DUF3888 domain-containing protein n=1 Tax=Psychrobacillus sp. OK028 TaxID=1884359 RepID=UPI0008908ED9|nr:DUF3888 domain-containing protein [Psychrobacillus sp. OK028]SDN10238.1 Protein of unknown function [Psychrobacillus sp. OK028]